ncbi:MarR family winged helix-turn-helix transcriptional regulator [Salidesulfovibrio brasiliensis]|uniref:MarR family winged helix-turn-helix transcriptional regulator n=1 Tax=Salidesulfovibrio brasiliensis TaxID=221711 RepID=UPI0006D17C23|nr:MarR family transcriptional regulator [Salidesulfovibrio brasiliensis]
MNDIYDIDNSYPMQIRSCLMILQENLNRRFREAGHSVTHNQWKIMTFIENEEGLSQQDLARRYRSSKVTIVRFLNKLEKDGLIVRKKDPEDGRCNRLYLTEKGRSLQAELTPLARANANLLRQGLSDNDIETLLATLKTIIANGDT